MTDGSAPTGATGPEPTRPDPPGTRAGAASREPGPGTGARRPTLDEVARLAGVGRGTASRVLNASPRVSERAREAVTAAVEALGYVPNPAARTLVTRRTNTVALVVSETGDRLFGEPYFAATVRGIGERLSAAGVQLLLTMTTGVEERRRAAAYLTAHHVDGAVLLSLHADDDLPEVLEARGVPTVCAGRQPGRALPCVVDADNREGGRLAVEHLLATGRRRLAVLTGPPDMGAALDRLEGALDAARAAGVEPRVLAGDYGEESGAEGARRLLSEGEEPDGLVAASDLMAVGALRVLRAAGRRVPDDVAVVGFDDSPVCRHTDPPLTSVHQPVEEMGALMASLLLDRLAGREVAASTVLPTRLVVRAST